MSVISPPAPPATSRFPVFPIRTARWLLWAVVITVALALLHSPLTPLPGVGTLLVLPGAALMSSMNVRTSALPSRLSLAVCLSMLSVMVVGLVTSLVGPLVGDHRPLDAPTQVVVWLLLGALIVLMAHRQRRDPVTWVLDGVDVRQLYLVMAGSSLALLAILGVARLNLSGSNTLAVASNVVDVAVLVAAVVGAWRQQSRWPVHTIVYFASLAILLSASLRGGHLYGWDVQKEFGVATHTIATGRWSIPSDGDPYASMLSLTVLPAVLGSVAKLKLLAFFQLVVPAILAFLPVTLLTLVNGPMRFVHEDRPAPRRGLGVALVVALVISSQAFSAQLVSITRQAMALTMLAVFITVFFDRAIPARAARLVGGLLILAISFTHYTTSYLLAGLLAIAWPVGRVLSRWRSSRLTPSERLTQRIAVTHRVLSVSLVVVALSCAFGWNLVVTRNYALSSPANAVSAKGVGISTSSGPVSIPAPQLARILEAERRQSAGWLKTLPAARKVKLVTIGGETAPATTPLVDRLWNDANFALEESIWLMAAGAFVYGFFRWGRRRGVEFDADVLGLTFAALAVGGVLRFSSTLASFYSPSRAAIVVSILIVTPVAVFLDDVISLLSGWWSRIIMVAGALAAGVMAVWATGLGTFVFGGVPPGSLTGNGVNAQDFTVSSAEFSSAQWLRNHVGAQGVVQTDEFGQLVMLSEPSGYDLLDEIVPTGVGRGSYIYLSTIDLVKGQTTVTADNGNLYSTFHTTTPFFNQHFNVVYSTGVTRIYH